MSAKAAVLLVTGGSRGIGAAVCQLASRSGWSIALAYRADAGAADALVHELRTAGGQAQAFQADVGDHAAIAALFDRVEAAMGLPDALVNNAGITGGIGPFVQLQREVLQRVFEVNVFGTMLCAQAAVCRWTNARVRGSIVNISSIAAISGSPGEYVHYAASKAAVDAFTIGLAREVSVHGIRVNAVAPGITATDIHATGGDPGRVARVAPAIAMQRAATAEEVAEAVVWLLSSKASYVTGTVLRVAGGL